MLTEDIIRSVCNKVQPGAKPLDDYVKAFASENGLAVLSEFEITKTPERLAAFMANVCHETGGLRIVRESTHYRAETLMKVFAVRYKGKPSLAASHAGKPRLAANFNYGFRLGNEDDGTDDDDGYNYRGGGPLQATGKGMYKWLERETGVPFGSNPQLIEVPEHWPICAALTWTKHQSAGNLNVFADQGNFEACCRGINTGSPFSTYPFNGWLDRLKWHQAWMEALSGKQAAFSGVYLYGSPKSPTVTKIQKRLNELRYGEGDLSTDGIFGTRTRSAVYDFQLENGLKADGAVGPLTWAKLFNDDDVKPYPAPANVALGVAGLRAAGDREIARADQDRAASVTLGLGSAFAVASQTGALDLAQELARDLGSWQSSLTTLIAVVKFGASNALPIACLIAAILLWRRFGMVVYDKVERWTRPVGGGS